MVILGLSFVFFWRFCYLAFLNFCLFVDEIVLDKLSNEEIRVSNEPYESDTGSISQYDVKNRVLRAQGEIHLLLPQQKLNEQTKSSKDSARPKSFSSFFQHLETKYFPYKQQFSHEPSPNEPNEENNPLGSSCNTTEKPKHHQGKPKNLSSRNSKGNDERHKPKKQRKSMFKSLFLLNTSRHQDRSSQSPSTDRSEMDKIQVDGSAEQNVNNPSQNEGLSIDHNVCKNYVAQAKSSKRYVMCNHEICNVEIRLKFFLNFLSYDNTSLIFYQRSRRRA